MESAVVDTFCSLPFLPFQARIAFLKGERNGQENLKNDLVRRIKMLEYALKQERAKFHKLKYGVDLNQGEMKPPPALDGSVESQLDSDPSFTNISNATWKQGRQLLRQYLQEIGYTDRIIDVRSNRVRALLGLNNNDEQDENVNTGQVNGNESNKRAIETQGTSCVDGVPQGSTLGTLLFVGRRTPAKKAQPSTFPEAMIMDAECAVMASLDFLSNTDVDMEDDEDISDDIELDGAEDIDDVKSVKRKGLWPRVTSVTCLLLS